MAATASLAARVVHPGASFAANCSCSSVSLKSRTVFNVLRWRASKVSNSRASSSSRVRSDASSSSSSDGEAVRDQNAAFVSRRWVALVLPAMATLGSVTLPNGEAKAGHGAVERRDVENGGEGGRVELRTLNGCGLGVARYPDFVYNAEGGGGSGQAQQLADGRTHVLFDTERLYIPAVSFDTTTILGLPLPPGLKIEVVPKTLEGYVEQATGKVELNFLANFYFTAGSLYSAPPLVVDAKLTTEIAQGVFRGGRGQRLDSSGNVKLVAVARLAPVNDLFLSTFLTLPTDCLAELSANLAFSYSDVNQVRNNKQ